MKITIKIIVILLLFLILTLFFDNNEIYLGNGYAYNYGNKMIYSNTNLPQYVIDFDYNSNFIIVKQKPKLYDDAWTDSIGYNYSLGRENIYYWIIDKNTHKVLGPLTLQEYIAKQKKYKIPKSLYFKRKHFGN